MQDSIHSHGTARTHSMVQTHGCYPEHHSIPDLSKAEQSRLPVVQGTRVPSFGFFFDVQGNNHARAVPTFSCIHICNAHSSHRTSIPCAQGDQHTYSYSDK